MGANLIAAMSALTVYKYIIYHKPVRGWLLSETLSFLHIVQQDRIMPASWTHPRHGEVRRGTHAAGSMMGMGGPCTPHVHVVGDSRHLGHEQRRVQVQLELWDRTRGLSADVDDRGAGIDGRKGHGRRAVGVLVMVLGRRDEAR